MACLRRSKVDPALLREALKGKTKEQQKVIKYFVEEGGCLSFLGIGKPMSDTEYERMVFSRRDSMDFKAKALNKIGLDEDQVKEIPPVQFEGYVYENCYAKQTAKGKWVSSAYQISWLFFSSTQVYLYWYTFHMDKDTVSEETNEYFYKDITSVSTITRTETAHALGNKKIEVQTSKFSLVVPGDKLFVSMEGVKEADAIIQGMKQKLREKKNE